MEEVLQNLGHLPTKQNEKEAWYLNPFASESQASFKLDKRQNVWYLHSEGVGGNNTYFIQRYLNASVKEVLEWAEKQNFSSFHSQIQLQSPIHEKANYQIITIKELQNKNLKSYLRDRGLSEMVFPLVKEVHFKLGDKNLYAVGFANLSGGWELRNQFYKGAILKKDISIISCEHHSDSQNQNENGKDGKNVAVFEGFIDALSFVEMRKKFNGDLLVMNSIALLGKTKEHLKSYSEINLFLDNDNAGMKCRNEILQSFPNAKDCSEIYTNHKDLNEHLIDIKNDLSKSGSLIVQKVPNVYKKRGR
ncbi:hypothetical protein HX13_00530 [Chryseobacterium sp. P1-3]|nr:hypothetical protein HX13_00530 [Chryseobacterium sp. P1-3]